jgi:hypothetical protein
LSADLALPTTDSVRGPRGLLRADRPSAPSGAMRACAAGLGGASLPPELASLVASLGGAATWLPNLESRTHNYVGDGGVREIQAFRECVGDGPAYAIVVREYGRTVEATAMWVSDQDGWRRLCGRAGGARCRSDSPVRSEASLARSRSELRRRNLAAGGDHLWTFTKRGKFDSRDEALAAWAVFERRARRALGAYVAVVERHESGGYHIHAAVHGFRPVTAFRRLWYRSLGGSGDESGSKTPGSVNVRDRRARSILATSRYLSKYLTEDGAGVPAGRKLFFTSKGLVPCGVRRFVVPHSLDSSMTLSRVSVALGDAYRREFGRGGSWSHAGLSGFTLWAGDT